MILKGIRFGMLLQLAIGPMCLMVFNTAATYGFLYALPLIAGIATIDAFYIAISCAGVAAVINHPKIKIAVKLLGCLVLILFGINLIAESLHLSFLPQVALLSRISAQNLFFQGLILTASNPLTVIFWGGMLSAQVVESRWNNKQLGLFALGCVLATIMFLTAVSILANLFSDFLPETAIQYLNIFVGVMLILFGIRLLLEK